MKKCPPRGYLTLTLHAHLPWVVHHGTWPHGLEWLWEAAAETYLPLLRLLKNLERDGLALKANVNLSPVLLEQLAHPTFQAQFPEYLNRKILAAQEDEAYFRQSGEEHFAHIARYWQHFFAQVLEDFEALDRDLVRAFRHFNDSGSIEVITCCATHGYMPLLGTDESIRAQVQTGVTTHERHLGCRPRGMWAPECGYRPAGLWQMPVPPHGSGEPGPTLERKGVEQILAESGLAFFFVDTHVVVQSGHFTPYELRIAGGPIGAAAAFPRSGEISQSLYHAYYVDGPGAADHPIAIFPRDSRTGLQVWSGAHGYPADPYYLDFHKKRWPGGHRYWQVTDSQADMALKTPWYPDRADARTRTHAEHFVSVVYDVLKGSFDQDRPPVLSSPFDAELFGHWWFEGPSWLEQVVRIMAREDFPITLATGSEYLECCPTEGFLEISEGSWGRNGTSEVWLNSDTAWTWAHIYAAEEKVSSIVTEGKWRDGGTGERIAKQLCRELLLMEASDWQFLITTEAARDYAEHRFSTHLEQFQDVLRAWDEVAASGTLGERTETRLRSIEERDNLFSCIDPGLWKRLDSQISQQPSAPLPRLDAARPR